MERLSKCCQKMFAISFILMLKTVAYCHAFELRPEESSHNNLHTSQSDFQNVETSQKIHHGFEGEKISRSGVPKFFGSLKLRTYSWHDDSCNFTCSRKDIGDVPPLLVVSLDGFRRDYLDRHIVLSLEKMAQCGTRAEKMYAVYPSKTFPNHYSIATGLYPEAHGIVDNSIRALEISPKLIRVKGKAQSRYFKGEPIWNVVVRSKMRSACYFWPGCDAVINGLTPTFNKEYNKSLPFSKRVQQITQWLSLPQKERPSLIMAYFNQPDNIGHFHKKDEEVSKALEEMDGVIDDLFSSLNEIGMLNCINVVVLSDHGMQDIKERIYLNEYADTDGLVIANGVVARIMDESKKGALAPLKAKLICENSGEVFRIYGKDHIPKRYHYASSDRIGDLILEGQPGTIFFSDKAADYNLTADHGYDYIHESMQAIFFARGPDIQRNLVAAPFQNIELFNLFKDLLRITSDYPNNGTEGRLNEMLRNVVKKETGAWKGSAFCKASSNVQTCRGECSQHFFGSGSIAKRCSPRSGLRIVEGDQTHCQLPLCAATVIVRNNRMPAFGSVAVLEELNDKSSNKVEAETAENSECFLAEAEACVPLILKQKNLRDSQTRLTSILADRMEADTFYAETKLPLYPSFEQGAFRQLQNLTLQYFRKYGRLSVITGPIYDRDKNGLADPAEDDTFFQKKPTHVFRVIVKYGAQLSTRSNFCGENKLDVLTFILPNVEEDLNCLEPKEYLLTNTARIKDVELLTGLRFFEDRENFDNQCAIYLRTFIVEKLWDI